MRENAELRIARVERSVYLQHPFRQASFLGKLLEILRVGIVIDREVALHRPQLMMLKARSHPLRPAVGAGHTGGPRAPSAEGHVYVVRVQVCNINPETAPSLRLVGLRLEAVLEFNRLKFNRLKSISRRFR